jgi:hypothetical protein
MLFILIIISSPLESVSMESDVRVRRKEPQFVQTTCIVLNSVAKERCSTTIQEYNQERTTETQSCVIDEKFRVKYKIEDGQMIISTIETFGRNFPRLTQVDSFVLDLRRVFSNFYSQ